MKEQLNSDFEQGTRVSHPDRGVGTVLTDMGRSVVVRFENDISECEKNVIEKVMPLLSKTELPRWDIPLEFICRVQAETILSINDAWGMFSRSRIELLPHQLWVCQKVNQKWPCRWLVADDVGLGKTIEAGIILSALLSKQRVHRILILCPASLKEQWQERLGSMFDIRFALYLTEADTAKSGFWEANRQVVASLHTLRIERNNRLKRLLQSDPWDLVIVDEAHHLNADERQGPTLGYQLIKTLETQNRIKSMIFFTGTPHRGKNFGFLSLLQLLRSDLFDPKKPMSEQLKNLKHVMIRNNKYNVTDLKGNRLFQEPRVVSETYSYSSDEQHFYDRLSNFILQGKAYATSLSESQSSTAMLVLITMQKLASSSVAAIRSAITGRLDRIQKDRKDLASLKSLLQDHSESERNQQGDGIAGIEEAIVKLASSIRLMANEEEALAQLKGMSLRIGEETKIRTILDIVQRRFEGESILFFTEYKATQSMLMSCLIRHFGEGSVTFINGDGKAGGVLMPGGAVKSFYKSRQEAANEFNSGQRRFLVSTEAAGEGIDLQENCHALVHVDLPWNPMRLHQRVGRLNRYGQTARVDVLTMRNPDTVETRIWDKLTEKINQISLALSQAMDEPEDLAELVLGMSPAEMIQTLFSDANQQSEVRLQDWFSHQTASFGGQDVVDTVKEIVGNVTKFDFHQVSEQIPKVDLPDFQAFFENSLRLNGRRVTAKDGSISFMTPESWMGEPGIRGRYSDMVFDRSNGNKGGLNKLLGIGHKLAEKALEQGKKQTATITALNVEILANTILAFKIHDRVTDGVTRPSLIIGVEIDMDMLAVKKILRDWELLKILNGLPIRKTVMTEPSGKPKNYEKAPVVLELAKDAVKEFMGSENLDFKIPDSYFIGMLWSCN